jgi:hypothetical protein
MKLRHTKLSFLLLVSFLFGISCSQEPLVEPTVEIEMLDNAAYINQQLSIVVKGKGDFCTFYSGLRGREYDSFPDARGQIINFGDTLTQVYQLAGEYNITAIATSYGNWGEDSEQEVAEMVISVEDNVTDIVRVFMTEPRYRLANIQNDTVYVPAGDIDLSNVSLQVITVSLQATVYPNGDLNKGYPGGEEFPGDYSGADPHFLVESPAKTTKKYPLVFQ